MIENALGKRINIVSGLRYGKTQQTLNNIGIEITRLSKIETAVRKIVGFLDLHYLHAIECVSYKSDHDECDCGVGDLFKALEIEECIKDRDNDER